LILFFKRFQQDAVKYAKLRVVGSFLRWLANMRIADDAIDRIPMVCSEDKSATEEVPIPGKSWKKIVTNIPTDRALINLNTVLAFRHVLENYEFDYLFRTNTSSYVDCSKLLEFLESQPSRGVYGGLVGSIFSDIEFASGAGILLSKDVVEQACNSIIKYKHGYIDDVALGVALTGLDGGAIPILPLPRIDAYTLDSAASIDSQLIMNNFHFRCKSNSAEETIEIMQYIHSVKKLTTQI
jgi:hypothetical protein